MSEKDHKSIYINKKEVLKCIKEQFNIISETTERRTVDEQNIIGSFINVLESELKKDIKQLKEVNLLDDRA